jgi:hypothetical protein
VSPPAIMRAKFGSRAKPGERKGSREIDFDDHSPVGSPAAAEAPFANPLSAGSALTPAAPSSCAGESLLVTDGAGKQVRIAEFDHELDDDELSDLTYAFQACDADHSGYIEATEMHAMLAVMGAAVTATQISELMRESKKEFALWLRSHGEGSKLPPLMVHAQTDVKAPHGRHHAQLDFQNIEDRVARADRNMLVTGLNAPAKGMKMGAKLTGISARLIGRHARKAARQAASTLPAVPLGRASPDTHELADAVLEAKYVDGPCGRGDLRLQMTRNPVLKQLQVTIVKATGLAQTDLDLNDDEFIFVTVRTNCSVNGIQEKQTEVINGLRQLRAGHDDVIWNTGGVISFGDIQDLTQVTVGCYGSYKDTAVGGADSDLVGEAEIALNQFSKPEFIEISEAEIAGEIWEWDSGDEGLTLQVDGRGLGVSFAEYVYMSCTELLQPYLPGDWHKSTGQMRTTSYTDHHKARTKDRS